MNRLSFLVCLVACGAAALVVVARRAQSGQAGALVRLQPGSPGIQQIGNTHVSGVSLAGQFEGGGAGLTGLNASGIASGSLSDSRLSPNVALLNTPQTFTGAHVFSGGLSTNQFALTTGGAAGMVLTSDASGVGSWQSGAGLTLPYSGSGSAASPTAAFKVTNTGTGYGIWGEGRDGVRGLSSALGGNGVFGESNNGTTAIGVHGISTDGRGVYGGSVSGYGVYGHSSAGYGVYGNGTSGFGVYGHSSGTAGVYGESTNGSGGYGVHGSSNAGYGVVGQTLSPTGRGVWGVCVNPTGASFGGRFDNPSTSGYGVLASSSATSGATFGGYFQADSTAGIGVYGYATATSGFSFGGLFQSNSPDGRAVRASNAATTGQAVGGRFSTASTAGLAIWSSASAATGATFGGYFESSSNGGIGMYGQATSASGVTYGGRFASGSNAGIGVSGIATAGTGAIYGVHGTASGVASYGVYSLGNLGTSGNKQFRIDHPFDPENKYLMHYCAEGPEPLNVYSGNVTTDSKGEAWVQLPDYFAEINKDFRYTLTVVDDTDSDQFVFAKVAREIRDDRFKIRTSAPQVKVSWRVEAVRNDLWVRKYGAPVEADKEGLEIGTYQHPELYGQPKEKGMNYQAERAGRADQAATPPKPREGAIPKPVPRPKHPARR